MHFAQNTHKEQKKDKNSESNKKPSSCWESRSYCVQCHHHLDNKTLLCSQPNVNKMLMWSRKRDIIKKKNF